ncbi:hypothetical protein PSAB6_240077 [Paraburkholderia sabiae]|nr:hypothetical protein PSAB6_240077 [Paraburkholderia sabiae]
MRHGVSSYAITPIPEHFFRR